MQPHLLKLVSRLPRLLATLVVAPCLSFTAQAQISVGPTGSSTNRFDVAPPATEWSTAAIGANANEYTTVTVLDIAIQQLAANSITAALPFTSSDPAPATNLVVWSSSGQYIQTTPSAVAANLLQATLRNDSGGRITFMILSYALTNANTPGAEEIPGHRLYYSLSGAPGSWTARGTFFTQQSISLDLAGTPWPDGTLMYLLFVDDNSISNPDGFYQIDNFSIGAVVSVPPTCVGITGQPQSITVPERTSATFSLIATGTPQHIQWYRKDGLGSFNPISGANASSYAIASTVYPADHGAQFRAVVTNSVCSVTSSVATLSVVSNRFYDSFETQASVDCWVADNGWWEIGALTNGLAVPDGTNVAATVLHGSYEDNRQSRLVSCPIVIPVATNFPRLRFWHWWSFNYGDFGQVQISTNNGVSWQALSDRFGEVDGQFNYWSSGEWTQGWLDLTPYAGRIVRLGFYFSSTDAVGGNDVADGWYVDEVTVESGPMPQFRPDDGFEDFAAVDRWTADHGVWEIGAPTSGPGAAHSGSNCLATLLDGRYADNTWSRISSAAFTVPAANLNPRLRFWHWWSFNYGDFGQVHISTNNGTNWQALSDRFGEVDGQFNYWSSGKWTQGWLDLTPYAGRTVRLGFYFYARDAVGGDDTAAGWFIDDLLLETGALAQFATSDGFEDLAAEDRWTADHGVWEIGVPTSGPGAAHSGSNCLATLLDRRYADNTWSRISSPSLIVPAASLNPRLRFWHWWNFNYGDFGQVHISTNNGTNWQALSDRFGEVDGQFNYWSSGKWTQGWLDLTPYAGRTIRLGFYFYARDAIGGDDTDAGWFIDDLLLETGPLPLALTPDSFEDAAALNRWTADHGVWEIGVPIYGPPTNAAGLRAHGGSNCLATLLDGNYADNTWSRVSSQPFVVPPIQTNPRLRFWHWWSFSSGDLGKVQIRTEDATNWIDLATYTTSSPWAQPELTLGVYAGKTVRLGFYFFARDAVGGDDTAPGWYIDEVRLLHDFGLAIDSTVARTQQNVCVPISVAATGAVSSVGFVLDNSSPQGAAVGVISNLTITPAACWHVASFLELPNSRWSVLLTNGCSTASMGVKPIANLCFDATSTQSGFAHWRITGLSATNQNASNPLAVARSFGGRAVIIGDQPLIEAWINTNGQRMVTTFGKPNTGYLIRYTNMLVCETNSPTGQCIVDASNWPIGMTNFVPGTMSFSQPLTGTLSNAPILFLDPKER